MLVLVGNSATCGTFKSDSFKTIIGLRAHTHIHFVDVLTETILKFRCIAPKILGMQFRCFTKKCFISFKINSQLKP